MTVTMHWVDTKTDEKAKALDRGMVGSEQLDGTFVAPAGQRLRTVNSGMTR